MDNVVGYTEQAPGCHGCAHLQSVHPNSSTFLASYTQVSH